MATQQQGYYRPYTSDSESDSASESGSDTTEMVAPNYRQFATDLQLTKAAGPDLPTDREVLDAKVYTSESPYDAYVPSATDVSGITIPKTESAKTNITSIIMLDSRNRDKAVYPQPTFLTLRLPRVYTRILNFQVIQVKLLSSFFYFRPDKNNLDVSIQEIGRLLTNGSDNVIQTKIREGTYDILTLLNELNLQLNRTPIFYDFINGFSDFAPLFATSGDFSLNFNQPGDNFFDALNKVFITNPTMTQIVGKYFQTQSSGFTSYQINELKVAYYYPVLKEILLDPDYPNAINLTLDAATTPYLGAGETVNSHIIYNFAGLRDPIVQYVVNNNLLVLDNYRLAHTFRFSLINRYVVSYSTNNNRITFSSTQLNTSLYNLLTLKYNQFLAEQLTKYNLTSSNYTFLSVQKAILLTILTDEYYYLQRQFAQYFGIQFNSYAVEYYTNVNNEIPLQNAVNNVGVSSNYDSNVIFNNINPEVQNELALFRKNPPSYWPNLTHLPYPTISSIINLNTTPTPTNIAQFNHPYNSITDSEDQGTAFIDSNGRIYQNQLLRSADTLVPINPTEYTVFRFYSDVRQQLRVSAFPRPTKYRYPLYNSTAYDAAHVKIFDNSYCFVQNQQNKGMDISPTWASSNLKTLIGFNSNQSNFALSYLSSYSLQSTVNLNIQTNRLYYTFYTPQPPTAQPSDPITYPFSVNISPASLVAPMNAFLYHDRAAFMADVIDVRNEKPIHYTQSIVIDNITNTTLNFTAYAKQQYYLLLRSASTTFRSMDIRVVPYFPNQASYLTLSTTTVGFDPLATDSNSFIWAQVNDPAFIRLPTAQQTSNNGKDKNFSVFSLSNVPLGYDLSGVSTDLTDYVGYIPQTYSNVYLTSATRIDPISGFIFQVGQGFNSTTGVYIPNTGNALLYSNATFPYTPQKPPSHEYVIAHWYNDVFIQNSPNQPYVPPETYSQIYTVNDANVLTSIVSYPYTQYLPGPLQSNVINDSNLNNVFLTVDPNVVDQTFLPYLQGYTYQDGLLALGNGVVGISLIPDDGVWDLKRIMLRSAFTVDDSNIDTNRQIVYLGIYFASYLNSRTSDKILLKDALMTFQFSQATTYPQGSNTNFGFDTVGGTYYEWKKTTGLTYLYGYAQNAGILSTDSNSYYMIVPFDGASNLTTYSLLSGSLVPYPFYSDASGSAVYVDGKATPTGQYVIQPKTNPKADPIFGPPTGFTETQSKYEQSIPITASLLQYLQPPTLVADISGCKPYGPSLFKGVTAAPPVFSQPCTRVQNHILMPIAGDFMIYTFQNNTTTYELTYYKTVTPDIFFTNNPQMELVGISGNTTVYAFLGLSQLANYKTQYFPPINQVSIQIETYNPVTGYIQSRDLLTDTYPLVIPAGEIVMSVDSFNYNDKDGYTFTYTTGIWSPSQQILIPQNQFGYTSKTAIASPTNQIYTFSNAIQATNISMEILQADREIFGRFFVAYRSNADPSQYSGIDYPLQKIITDLYYVDTNKTQKFGLTEAGYAPPPVVSLLTPEKAPKISRLSLISKEDPNYEPQFTDITLVQNPYETKVFLSFDLVDLLNNGGLPTYTYYEVTKTQYATQLNSNYFWEPSHQAITNYEGDLMQPAKILGGGNGSFWIYFNEATKQAGNTTPYDALWGNRGDSTDFPVNVSNAYQIFYPTQRIVMTKVAPSYNPITDISGLLPFPEYPHSAMFVYDDSNKFVADISANKWGLESSSNFLVSDTTFSGYYFNAATLDVPLMPSTTYYLALRGYTPTEKSQVLLRFNLPNRYDFGYARLIDLSNEILSSQSQPQLFNSNYLQTIQAFNSNFIFSSTGKVFGSNAANGYAGSNVSNVTGFGDFLSRFIQLNAAYNSNVTILNQINNTVNSNLQNFIRTDLINIIPPTAINRQRYTDPLRYSILWKSALLNGYIYAEDNWGLGWNLGFAKADTVYDTTHVADSFYKILDDYINLRLNDEYDMNHMDAGAKENLAQSQETTGETKAYNAKLLLASFGSYAQTLISNPIIFQIPIPKIDKLTFTWTDNIGQTINNSECEWNMVVQLVEEQDTVRPAAPSATFP